MEPVTHRVEARRSDGWWALDFPDEPRLHSQVRRLDQATAMAIAAYADGPGIDVTPEQIEIVPILEGDLAELAVAAELRERATQAQQDAQTALVTAARRASAMGLTVRDIGTITGVTSSYVSRITATR